tara:strand:- start:589 stop:1503 length:915 start_codon:yes stop_codon:yes gene_type:complete
MANEILYSDLVTNGGAVSEVLSSLVVDSLVDPTDLRSLCINVPFDTYGSSTMAITRDAAAGAFASIAENAAVGNSANTTSEFTLAVSKYSRAYELSDLVGMSGSPIDLQRMVKKLSDGVALTITDLIVALFPALSNNVGASGSDLTMQNIYDAQFQLNSSSATGPYACVLHPVQMNDFRNALRGETGATQFFAPQAEMLATKGPGFQGTFNGIEFHQSDSVETVNAGADRNGAMFDSGCFAYTMGNVSRIQGHIPASNVILDAGQVLVELVRDGYGGQSAAVAHMYPAVAEVEDARGVGIITDA